MLQRHHLVSCLALVAAVGGCQVHVAMGPAKRSEATIAESSERNRSLAAQRHQPDASAREGSSGSLERGVGAPSALAQRDADSRLLARRARAAAENNEPDGVARAVHEADSAVEPRLLDHAELLSPGGQPVPPAPRDGDDAAASGTQAPMLPLPEAAPPADERFPINLGTALQLAGANNLQIALASERVREALARLEGSDVLWIPSLVGGVQYNAHTGRLQDTSGAIVDVNRQSVFVGGGAVLDGAPLTGGSGAARLFVDMSLSDIYFAPLAAQQAAAGAQYDESAVFNDTLLEVTVRYLELLEAQSQAAIAHEAAGFAEELARITDEFARAGIGLRADAERALAELADRRRELLVAEERVRVVSAELARLLRLPSAVTLFAVDPQPVPLALVEEAVLLDDLIAEGLSFRPELRRHQARVGATLYRLRQEQWRPWLPNLHLGVSSGGFGGGRDDAFGSFSDRTDFDALALWEVRNFGLGNRALQRERGSQHRQACLEYEQIRDLVAAEVTQAWQQVQYRRRQIDQSAMQVESAARALPLNFEGIRGRELRPIEAQQAIAALAAARNRYLSAVVAYNQAQFALLRAVGVPPEAR